jgi:hypothetical protein
VCDWGRLKRLKKDNPSSYGFVTINKLKTNNNFNVRGCLSSFIPMEKKGPSNLFEEWDWHTFELQSWKHIWWVSFHNSYVKKRLTLNILWIHQQCHVLKFSLKRC